MATEFEAVYEYKDAQGNVLFECVRYPDKKFRYRRPDGKGGYVWRLKASEKLPYRIHEVLQWNKKRSQEQQKYVCIVEGEKDTDKLWSLGVPATTNPFGAGKWKSEYNHYFEGLICIVIPDVDDAGWRHMQQVTLNLYEVADCVVFIGDHEKDLEEKQDISDWLDKHSIAEFNRMVNSKKPIALDGIKEFKDLLGEDEEEEAPEEDPTEESPLPAPAPEPTPAPPPVEETLIPLEKDLTNEEIKELTEMEISPDEVFKKTCTFIEERVGLPAGGKELLALWAMNSYTQMVFDVFPYMLVESVTQGLGKTTVMEILNSIVYKGEIMVAPTPASIYEGIHCGDFLTAFIDEYDQLGKESKQEVLGIFNAGYKKGGTISRMRGKSGTSAKRKKFRVDCQKMFASIGGLKNTLLDRCIVIHMHRVNRTLKPTNIRPLRRDSAPIRKLLKAYALQEGLRLEELYDDQPDETYFPQFKHREAELFSTLLMHTKLMSPEEAGRVLKIALGYSTSKHNLMEQKSDSLTLIREFHDALTSYPFNVDGTETFRPTDLIDHLVGYSDGWAKRLKGDTDNRAKDGSRIRDFLKDFDLPKAERKRDGSHHNIEVVVQALAQALPQAVPQVQQPSQPTDNSKDNGVAVTPNTATGTAISTTGTPTSTTETATVQPVDNKIVNGGVAVVSPNFPLSLAAWDFLS